MFVGEQEGLGVLDTLDTDVSCLIPLAVTNEEVCCSVGKTVCRRQTVHPALSSTTQVMNTPVVCAQTHTDVCNNLPHSYHDPRKNAHHEDVRVGSANASTQSRSKGGGEFHRRYKHCWMFVHEQQGALDVLMLSSDPQTLVVIDE
jgi:hypothetical protein